MCPEGFGIKPSGFLRFLSENFLILLLVFDKLSEKDFV